MKLKTAFSYLTMAELKHFGRVLDSGLLGNQEALAVCFRACMQLAGEIPEWGEVELAAVLFPGKDPIQQVKYLRTRTSAMLRYVEKYLAWKEFDSDPVLKASCLVMSLNRRGWKSGYQEAYRTAITQLNEAPLKGFLHYAAEVGMFDGYLEAFGQSGRAGQPSFQAVMDSLDAAYLMKKYSLATKAASEDRIRQTSHRYTFLPEIESWMASHGSTVSPLVYLHSLIYRLTASVGPESDNYYFSAKHLYFLMIDQLLATQRFEAQDQFICLVNYCVLRSNMKSMAFRLELVNLYKAGLNAQIGLVDGEIEPHDFINAFSVFLTAGDREAIVWLFQSFGQKIRGESALATRHHCNGWLQFWDGSFEEACESLTKALHAPPKRKDPQLEVELRAQLARAKYCLKEYSEAILHAKSVLDQIKEMTFLNSEKATSFRQFALIFVELCRAANARNIQKKAKCASLLRKISETKVPFFASLWVKPQLQMLEKEK
ncbi:MAG: hypothetical protein RLZZ519_2974 [Bacteroidota bacterium]|jgi:hypothetical protein